MDTQKLALFHQIFVESFNLNELEGLCFDLGINFESLPGNVLDAKARGLLLYCSRHNRLHDLVERCQVLRPTTIWPNIEYYSSPSEEIAYDFTQQSSGFGKQTYYQHLKPSFLSHIENNPKKLSKLIGIKLRNPEPFGVIGYTNHSVTEKWAFDNHLYVVKRTKREYCDLPALKRLIGKNITGYDGGVSVKVATPLAVWETKDYIWELHPYYHGILLYELVVKNKQRLQGDVLSQVFNAMMKAINRLHELKILHRDISPTNFLINGQASNLSLILIDSSFCTTLNGKNIIVADPNYTSPEQRMGKPVIQSDWYSIAATTYFIRNGDPPNKIDKQAFFTGLEEMSSVYYSTLPTAVGSGRFRLGGVCKCLLQDNVAERPKSVYECVLVSITRPLDSRDMLAILKMGDLGFIIVMESGVLVGDKNTTLKILDELQLKRSKEMLNYIHYILG